MKKVFLAVAAIAAVFSVTNADARNRKCEPVQTSDLQIHNIYTNGSIDEVRSDLLATGYDWKVKARNNTQIWKAVNENGQDVVVKLKGNKYKEFVKAKVDGEKVFVKDINPTDSRKHVAKLLEDGSRVVVRDVIDVDGSQMAALK